MFEIKGVSKYFGGLLAVSDLNMRISKGEIVGLIGPNGAGKTTVFNLITGYLRPSKGEIVFNGKHLAGQKPHSIAEKGIVRTFQANAIFHNFSVLKNIIASCHLQPRIGFWESILHLSSSQRKEELILNRAIEILEFVGLDAVKDLPARSLPHGYKRMLGIALSMAADPQLLLLDEPLSGMNVDEANRVVSLIKKIWGRGTTIFLIEHNMREAMNLCQRIIVLEMGRKIAEGSPEEVRANQKVIQAYLGTGKHAT
jgi:branched-chain amino acid transport system ATP-binding protein